MRAIPSTAEVECDLLVIGSGAGGLSAAVAAWQGLGGHCDDALIEAYLAAGPGIIASFGQHTAVKFVDGNRIPDLHGRTPAAGLVWALGLRRTLRRPRASTPSSRPVPSWAPDT